MSDGISVRDIPVYDPFAALDRTVTSELGKDEFLRLLIARLENQDPLEPSADGEFIAQLAQFSTLEQMTNINDTLESGMGLADYLGPLSQLEEIRALLSDNQQINLLGAQTINNMMAANLIGRTVVWQSNEIALPTSGEVAIQYNLESAADTVVISIYDESGNIVCTLTAANQGAGSHSLAWDGNNTDGERLASGNYSYQIVAVDASGEQWNPGVSFKGQVDAVKYYEGQPYLDIDGVLVSLANVQEISME